MAIIGREPPSDLIIPAPQVSAMHAEIEPLSDGTFHLRDLGSTNGTYVNGHRVLEAVVSIWDELGFGSYRTTVGACPGAAALIAPPQHLAVPEEMPWSAPPPPPADWTSAQPAAEATYAGFWLRVGATLIDCLILMFVGSGLGALLVAGVMLLHVSPFAAAMRFLPALAGLVIGAVYFIFSEASLRQATPGKRMLGLVVTDLQGSRLTIGRAAGRFFGLYLSGLTLGIGFLMAAWTERKQTLHDMLAGCLVIRRR